MALNTFQQEYMLMPFVTRTYTTACVLTTLGVQLEIVSPLHIYFNPDLIFRKWELWRLITNFMFFGTFGFNFFFNMIFMYRYCRMLEEGSFRGRTADFIFMFFLGGLLMTVIGLYANLVFLSQAFTIMLVYVWSRRNPFIRMSFFGVFQFQAPFLPWVLVGFSLTLGNPIIVDVIGIACGHIYYFLEDVFPSQDGGFKIIHTPAILKYIFDPPPDADAYEPMPEAERPGGFEWGQVEGEVVVNDPPQDEVPSDTSPEIDPTASPSEQGDHSNTSSHGNEGETELRKRQVNQEENS